MIYRKDIDGLRGIAVLAVVANHAAPDIPLFESGFIGVDIFFVLSGFLITSIISNELAHGSFSFIQFWSRRIRRILPSLILVLAVSGVVFSIVLSPYLRRELLKNLIRASTFTSNYSSIGEADYFGAQVLNPLLHLWSLAIEEQFYLFWPLACFAAYKYREIKSIKLMSLVILVTSFSANLITIYYVEDIPTAFYYPHTRVWELMAGASIGLFVAPSGLNLATRKVFIRPITSLVGLAFIVFGFVFIHESSYFPGYWALLPVFGTCLIIIAGPNQTINKVLLSNSIIVWFGKISYSLYLWHFPALLLLRQLHPGLTNKPLTVATVIASIGIAWLSTKLFENPIRFGSLKRIPSLGFLIALLAISFLPAYRLAFQSEPRDASYTLEKIQWVGRADQDKTCLRFRKEITVRTFIRQDCYIPEIKTNPTVFLIGDSHSASLRIGLKPFLATRNINLIGSTTRDCIFEIVLPHQDKSCVKLNNEVLKAIANVKPQIVVIDQYWAEVSRSGSVEKQLLNYISELNRIGIQKIIIVGQIPVWGTADLGLPSFLSRNFAEKKLPIPLRLPRQRIDNDPPGTMEYIASFKYPKGVTYLSMDEILCEKDQCLTMVGPNLDTDLIVWDYGHLTEAGSKYVVERLFSNIDELIKN